jgi:hypothetical protein
LIPGTDPFATQRSRRWRDRLSALLVASLVVVSAKQGRAQSPGGDAALAEALFQEGKLLMEQKRFAEACPKLAESQRIDPAGGTLLRLALCHELEGRTATAWAELQQALAVAQRDRHKERMQLAQQALDRVTPRLVKLAVVVPPEVATTPGLVVRRNGTELAPAAWGVSAAVDPGEHLIEAAAPGRAPFSKRIQLSSEGTQQQVQIPPLAPAREPSAAASSPPITALPPPPPSSSPPSPPEAPAAPSATPTASYVLGGVGLVSLGVGGFFGFRALSGRRDALDLCPQTPCSDRAGVDRNEDARRDAWVANAGVGIGVVALGLGVYLALRRPSAVGTARLAPAPGGALVLGRF